MSTDSLSRRGFLAGFGGLGAATLLGGCATSATGGGGQTSGAVSVESNLSAPAAKSAMQALIDAFNNRKGAQASLNTIAAETYRTQLQTKEFLSYVATAEAQELYVKSSTSTILPVGSNAKLAASPLVDKGKKLLDSAKEITQFFNRDSSDALQPTADTALIKFFNQPGNIDTILAEWQSAAEKVWKA